MNLRELRLIGGEQLHQRGQVLSLSQFELSQLADAAVRVAHELDDLGSGSRGQPLREPLGHLPSGLALRRRISKGVEPPLVRAVPAIDPVADHHPAIGSKVDIGGQDMLQIPVRVDQLEAGSVRFHRERTDATVARGTSEVGEEKVPLIPLGQSGSRIIDQPRWAVCDVHNRGDRAGRLHGSRRGILAVGMPSVFAIPRTTIGEVLIVHPPTGIAPLHDVDPAGFVSAV